jgi:hypothetical protein
MIRSQVKNEEKWISEVLSIRMKGRAPRGKTKIKRGKKIVAKDVKHGRKRDDDNSDDDDDDDNDSSLTWLVV